MIPIESKDAAGLVASGGGAVAIAVWLFSKMRKMLAYDSAGVASSAAFEATISALREENGRLHAQVLTLQGEVAKLQVLIGELTGRLATSETMVKQQALLDQMAREGKLDRRSQNRERRHDQHFFLAGNGDDMTKGVGND